MWNMIKMIVMFLKYPFYAIIIVLALFTFLVSVNVVIGLARGKRFKKGQHNVVKKKSFFRRILVDFPKQFTDDLFEKDPEFFKYQGLVVFEGRQGSGKTMSMVEFILRMQNEYPLAKTTTNFGLTSQDKELQNWFSSNDSKNFPPEMLGIITQNRKNRRIILGTSQNFYLLAKAIRSQATEVRRCTTLFRLLNNC